MRPIHGSKNCVTANTAIALSTIAGTTKIRALTFIGHSTNATATHIYVGGAGVTNTLTTPVPETLGTQVRANDIISLTFGESGEISLGDFFMVAASTTDILHWLAIANP